MNIDSPAQSSTIVLSMLGNQRQPKAFKLVAFRELESNVPGGV